MTDNNSTNQQHRSTTDEMTADRVATQRARYLNRTTDLRDRERLALGYREQGYSQGAIARIMGSAKQTIASYMDRIVAQYGLEAIETKPASARGDLEPITEERLKRLSEPVLYQWQQAATDHPKRVPDSVALSPYIEEFEKKERPDADQDELSRDRGDHQ